MYEIYCKLRDERGLKDADVVKATGITKSTFSDWKSGRSTFTTIGKKAEIDEYALKEMVGHSIQDIAESTYTVRDLEWLRKDIEKIK